MLDLSSSLVVFNVPDSMGKSSKLEKALLKRLIEVGARFGFDLSSVTLTFTSGNEDKPLVIINGIEPEVAERLTYYLITIKLDKLNHLYILRSDKVLEFQSENSIQDLVTYRPSLNFEKTAVNSFDSNNSWFESGNEMFMIRAGNATHIYDYDPGRNDLRLVNSGEAAKAEKNTQDAVWTNHKALWSPNGTYIITTHDQGVRLWGGPDFSGKGRFVHNNAHKGQFTKNEELLLTWDGRTEGYSVRAHNILTGECFGILKYPASCPVDVFNWGRAFWSPCGRYLAYPENTSVAIYDVTTMTTLAFTNPLTGKKIRTIPHQNVTFSWHNYCKPGSEPILAIWKKSETTNSPSRLQLLRVPSMQIIASKNIFAVGGEYSLSWSPNGAYCALITRVEKTFTGRGKVFENQIDIIHMFRPNMPVDSYMSSTNILDIFWNPVKKMFCTIHDNMMAVFHVITTKGITQMGKINIPKEINTCAWSPLGSHFVLASCCVADGTGHLWFGSCEEQDKSNSLKIVIGHKSEKSRLTTVAWDPSGRSVAAAVAVAMNCETCFRYQDESGFTIYSFLGREVYQMHIENLHRFQWRPHPDVPLSDETRANCLKNLKDYAEAIATMEKEKLAKVCAIVSPEETEKRQEFLGLISKAKQLLKQQAGYDIFVNDVMTVANNMTWSSLYDEVVTEISSRVVPAK